MQTLVSILLYVIAASHESVGAREVTVSQLDGTSVAGELQGWNEKQITVVQDGQEAKLPIERLISLRWSATASAGEVAESDGGMIEMTDGTVLPISDVQVASSAVTGEIAAPLPEAQRTIRLPARQVAAVRLHAFEPQVQEQWDEIREQDLASDVLVVKVSEGKSLNYFEGILDDVSASKIEFEIDGERARVDREKVAGWIYFRKKAASKSEPQCILRGRMGMRASATDIQLRDEMVHVTTASGAEFDWPLAALELADFSAGKIAYLSDLKPASQRWTPLVGLTAAAESATKYGQLRVDQSAFGGPLVLRLQGSGQSLGDFKSFAKGVAIRSRTELVYRLPSGFGQFVALAGIEPVTSATGAVRLTIFADERSVFDADVTGSQPAHEIKLDIAGVKRLKIVVDFGENLDTGDWLNLCEARLIK